MALVEVAYENPAFNDNYFKGTDLASLPDASLDLLVTFASLAAITRWL